MRKIIFSLMILSFYSVSSFGADLLLYKIEGGMDSQKSVVKRCEIFVGHTELAQDLPRVEKLIQAASHAKAGVAMHIARQTPSLEYWAVPVSGKKGGKLKPFFLVQDSSQREFLEGKEADELVKLIDRLCK